ncbi:glycosyltransferase family 2 protein [uncultured Paracoccus sp.]|uniref:glycosyltransferase family 2 protein n=1 Tax=uncultured Paracoccus sp. TaxID=189685 RepID=UPI0026306C63|nr:glycosyltransferase family 2 protein [uncultured Paracoccus sp.]
MQLTVLFSTHNGAGVLPEVLAAYAAQTCHDDWEMIVVNNASTDATAACLDSFAGRLPLTVVDHPVAGKNAALNAALPLLKGSTVIVTDDDAVPAPRFLDQWARVAREQPDYDLFGGRIEPLFQASPPSWMVEARFHFAEIFAACDHDEGPIRARDIFGPNMAVRRTVFDRGITFNESIGPNGSDRNYPMGSETEFCQRVEEHGHKAWFATGPRVRHIVRPHQLGTPFWTSRAYRHGLGVGLQERIAADQTSRPLVQRVTSLARGKLKQARHYSAYSLARGDELKAHEGLWNYHWHRGYTDAKTRAQL